MGFHVDQSQFDYWLTVEEFLRWALKDVQLPEKAEVCKPLCWKGIKY